MADWAREGFNCDFTLCAHSYIQSEIIDSELRGGAGMATQGKGHSDVTFTSTQELPDTVHTGSIQGRRRP